MQLESEYRFNLNQKILPGMVAAGNFSSTATFLAAAVSGGKVLITNLWHASKSVDSRDSPNLLNINQTVLSLTTGRFKRIASDRDFVFVGTGSSFMVYDVENNSDVFYKDLPDGGSSCVVGRGLISPAAQKPGEEPGRENQEEDDGTVAVVGGHCSLAGFNWHGEELLWTVTGDRVSALTIITDTTQAGQSLLVVGSEDFELRLFRQDDILHEITETEVVTNLCSMGGSMFGYGLANGTVGVYDRLTRLWRIKSKSFPTSLMGLDMNGDGVCELVTGWSNGKIDIRKFDTGEILFKDTLKSAIAGVVKVIHPSYNTELVLVCSTEGEVRIYKPVSGCVSVDPTAGQDLVCELTQRKLNLANDIKSLDNVTSGDNNESSGLSVPSSTEVKFSMKINVDEQKPGVDLLFATNNETIIKCAMIFAEGIFEGESHVAHPAHNKVSSTLKVTIHPPKDISVNLHMKIIVGQRNQSQFRVFDLVECLPRFAMYSQVKDDTAFKKPLGYVTFTVQERLQRFALWINQNFILDCELEVAAKNQVELTVRFRGLRQKQSVEIHINARTSQVTLSTDSLECAAGLVQSLVEYLDLGELTSSCHFPLEMELLAEVTAKVTGMQASRQTMRADLGEQGGLVRSAVVRAEDCRILHDMAGLTRYCIELGHLNRDLVSRYKIRTTNHQELLGLLRFVNQFIQHGGALRMGKFRTKMVAQCRQAVKDSQLHRLEKIIRTGCE